MPIRGTTTTWDDIEARRQVPVVSEAFATRFWANDSPLDRGVSGFGLPMASAGAVVGDVRGGGADQPVWEALYLFFLPPAGSGSWGVPRFLNFVVRTDGTDPLGTAPLIRQTLNELDPAVPVADLRAMPEIIAASTGRASFIALLLGTASILSLSPTQRSRSVCRDHLCRGRPTAIDRYSSGSRSPAG